jgi:hypothetical protein
MYTSSSLVFEQGSAWLWLRQHVAQRPSASRAHRVQSQNETVPLGWSGC